MTHQATGLDTRRARDYLRTQGLPVGTLQASLITGGRSNLTYELHDARRRLVMRMPPRGATESHDVTREASILRALAKTPVPVPRVRVICDDDAVLGAPFYVADFIEGAVLATARDAAELLPETRAMASHAIVEGLAAIHALDVEQTGLTDIGRPGFGYVDRQLRRWSSYAARSALPGGPLLVSVHDVLAADVPPQQRRSLVHGDYKFPNVMFDRDSGTLRAVLDWELATIGDPLADLGNLLAMWPEPAEPRLIDSPTTVDGFSTREAVIDLYTSLTGLDCSRSSWYRAFGLWKIACILIGVVERYRSGAMARDDFDVDAGAELVTQLGRLSEAALADPR